MVGVNSAELQVFCNLVHSFKCEEYAPCSEIQFVEIVLEMGQKQHDLCKLNECERLIDF